MQLPKHTKSALLAGLGVLLAAIAAFNPPRTLGYVVGQFSVEACTAAVSYENHAFKFTTNNPAYI
ncbi:MAG: hypothetical protein ABSH36_18420, partial [Solirubrobacteraceae bacterium]